MFFLLSLITFVSLSALKLPKAMAPKYFHLLFCDASKKWLGSWFWETLHSQEFVTSTSSGAPRKSQRIVSVPADCMISFSGCKISPFSECAFFINRAKKQCTCHFELLNLPHSLRYTSTPGWLGWLHRFSPVVHVLPTARHYQNGLHQAPPNNIRIYLFQSSHSYSRELSPQLYWFLYIQETPDFTICSIKISIVINVPGFAHPYLRLDIGSYCIFDIHLYIFFLFYKFYMHSDVFTIGTNCNQI